MRFKSAVPPAGIVAAVFIALPFGARAADAGSLFEHADTLTVGVSDTSTNAASKALERLITGVTLFDFQPGAATNVTGPGEPAGFETPGDFVNLAFFSDQSQAAPPASAPAAAPPNPSAPSLGDLGITPQQAQGSAQDQARLDKRSHMLRTHQILGIITAFPLAATLITSGLAGGRSSSSTGRDLHAALGSVTAGLYFTTAYFSVFAPRIPGTPTRGPIRLHKALAWIHGPGMILTPILGAMAIDQKDRGEKVHGIASAHGAVGAITGIAYGLAIVSVSVKF